MSNIVDNKLINSDSINEQMFKILNGQNSLDIEKQFVQMFSEFSKNDEKRMIEKHELHEILHKLIPGMKLLRPKDEDLVCDKYLNDYYTDSHGKFDFEEAYYGFQKLYQKANE
ncbi:unnamed protein product [Didymodactylos carnosus]|uniref:EF-hand domain-containing protein n=1 Tax=Didymodactylos carnosus TaxID=1234261 RepID=A0A815YZD0_9BILA|nr:unnamed protein product [Didymodactylos carnosus]CAF1577496.1 unnamed protein product [Didymodactylos carnosus]CAF3855383.1 unnamed protein product [Didymodactylos carnosus]CAF4443357.1 unnamed protein product [Didymodactylos carnosus]